MPRTAASDLASKLAGRRVREARIRARLTQSEVASRLGASPAYVTNVEAGRTNPTLGQLARIAEAIGTDLEISFPELDFSRADVVEPGS
jgi:transcriptional regulator with XRE-family HTH domain